MTAKPQLIRRKTRQRESVCGTPSTIGTLGVYGSEKATETLAKWTCGMCLNFWPWADCIRMFSQPGVLISAMVFLSSCFDSFSILVNHCCSCCCCFTRGSLEDLPDKLSPCHSTNAPSHNTSERVHLLLDQVFQIALSHTSYWHGKVTWWVCLHAWRWDWL